MKKLLAICSVFCLLVAILVASSAPALAYPHSKDAEIERVDVIFDHTLDVVHIVVKTSDKALVELHLTEYLQPVETVKVMTKGNIACFRVEDDTLVLGVLVEGYWRYDITEYYGADQGPICKYKVLDVDKDACYLNLEIH